MPIKPENKKRYPKNWKEIRTKVLKRAKDKCEFCGLKNHTTGARDIHGEFFTMEQVEKGEDMDAEYHVNSKAFMIVLTIAHLDHTPENSGMSNLRALCQKCHNGYDAKHRAETRLNTKKRDCKQTAFLN